MIIGAMHFLLVSLLITSCYAQLDEDYLLPAGMEDFEVSGDYREEVPDAASGEEPVQLFANQPLTSPPCMLPHTWMASSSNDDVNTRHALLNQREVLDVDDLHSGKVQLAGALAVDSFTETRSSSTLELTQYLGGCKQQIGGELLYLIFKARETITCHHANCTGPVVMDRECRARIHTTNFGPWNPFYVSCNSPEYYALPWKKLS